MLFNFILGSILIFNELKTAQYQFLPVFPITSFGAPSTGEWPIKMELQGGRFFNLRKAINGCYESIADDETLVTLGGIFQKDYCQIIITLFDFLQYTHCIFYERLFAFFINYGRPN